MVTVAGRLMRARPESCSGISGRRKLAPGIRACFFLVSIAILAAFQVAHRLEPDSSGFGTHRQLGLAECLTFEQTGYPCPTCGMTTAIAYLADGAVSKAWATQPAGFCIGLAAAGAALWSAVSAVRGRAVGFRSGEAALACWAYGSFAIAAAIWLIRWRQWAEAAGR